MISIGAVIKQMWAASCAHDLPPVVVPSFKLEWVSFGAAPRSWGFVGNRAMTGIADHLSLPEVLISNPEIEVWNSYRKILMQIASPFPVPAFPLKGGLPKSPWDLPSQS